MLTYISRRAVLFSLKELEIPVLAGAVALTHDIDTDVYGNVFLGLVLHRDETVGVLGLMYAAV